MADNKRTDQKGKKKERPKLIVYKEGKYFRSVDDMQRKDSREFKKNS